MNRIQTFHPAWGATAMTAGGVALVSLLDPWWGTAADDVIGLVLLGLAVLTVVATTLVFIVRLVAHREHFMNDLANPAMGAMTAAWPASLLIAALAVLQAGLIGAIPAPVALWAGGVFFVPGLLGTLVVGIAFYTRVVGAADVPLPAVSGNWYVPLVPLVLVPSILRRAEVLGLAVDPTMIALVGIVTWGAGFALFLLLAAIIGARLLIAAPPAPHAAPTWWVWLAPIGAGGLGLIAISRFEAVAAFWPDAASAAQLIASMLWGFGIWWAVFASIVIVRQRRELHFGMPFWGFGFPSAAIVGLTIELARAWDQGWLGVTATVLWVAVLVGLGALIVSTLIRVPGGRIFTR